MQMVTLSPLSSAQFTAVPALSQLLVMISGTVNIYGVKDKDWRLSYVILLL